MRVTAAGLAAGLVAGLFGVGGGVLLVPAIALWLGRPQHVAHATSLVAVAMAAAVGTLRFALDGEVGWFGVGFLAVGGLVGARVGAALLPRVPAARLRTAFGVVLLLLSVRFLLAGGSVPGSADGSQPDGLGALVLPALVLVGLVAGLASSTLGVGGGVVMVPALVLLGSEQHLAEGTSLAVIVPTALLGAWRHHGNGYTDWHLGGRLGVAALAGSWIGASVALALEADDLGRGFGVLLLVVGLLTLRRRPGP